MCDICKKQHRVIFYECRYIVICKDCYSFISCSNNELIKTFFYQLETLHLRLNTLNKAVDTFKESYLDDEVRPCNIKSYIKYISSLKRDIKKAESYINKNISIVSSFISVNLLFKEITDTNRVTAKEINELYNIGSKAFKTYKQHIEAKKDYKYNSEDISYLMNIQRFYDINRYSRLKLEAKAIAIYLESKINLKLDY